MKILESRSDIELLVNEFYAKVRADSLIGPIFNEVAKVDWDEHLPKITNFWCDLVLGEDTYKGRPFPPHIPLNLQPSHFERWLSLFIETVDANFKGQKADEIKSRALGIARNFLGNIAYLQKLKTEGET
ncbi:MAG: group III truncated hemoglobin [Pseudobdellovibrionaceae bacterium]